MLFLAMQCRHVDINQAFRRTFARLRAHNRMIFDGLHATLSEVYNKDTSESKLDNIARFSSVFYEQGCLATCSRILTLFMLSASVKIRQFSPTLFFNCQTACFFKKCLAGMIYFTSERSCYENWKYLVKARAQLILHLPKHALYSIHNYKSATRRN